MTHSLVDLPSEILTAIFLHLDPSSLASVSQTSKRIKELTTDAPIIWRHLCQTRFRVWAPHHQIAAKLACPLPTVDWRALFIKRVEADRQTLRLLDCVLEKQHGRIQHINDIARFGYDVKEVLLREAACSDEVEDVLARRYYANAVLQRIQREVAINVWKDLPVKINMPIEIGLGAFDVFTRTDEFVDFVDFEQDLNQLAKTVLDRHPHFHEMSARMKASALASSLREQGFKGVSDASYRALRNSFIGIVLRSPNHESLPLISVAIYCALAKRLGLDARPCGFLFHVYCLVYAPENYTLDGAYKPTNSADCDRMYLDPFRSSDEVNQNDLQRVLRQMGIPSYDHQVFLTHTNTCEMVLRTARNIMNSIHTIHQNEAGVNSSAMNANPNIDDAFYAAIWALLMAMPTSYHHADTLRHQYLDYLMENFQKYYPWDIQLIQDYVTPLFIRQTELQCFSAAIHRKDAIPKAKHMRDNKARQVQFRVGELFRHKRYHYEGVITGWHTQCNAREDWIQEMDVDSLPYGRYQSFYNVLVCDKSVRYVAQENIITYRPRDGPSPAMLKIAGRHFKRWDADVCVFVSNMRDEFPDD